MIQFFHVGKRFAGGQVALDDLSFEIARGEMVFITGASGAGKTTLLKLIFREDTPTQGQIVVNGRNVSSLPRAKVPFLRRTIGVVFQDFRLIARKTVFENVSYLPRILGMDREQQRRLAYETLRRVGLAHRLTAFPQQLSGGEKQRVAIARALINAPEILLADEPTGNLDPDLAREILELFVELNLRGTTILFATHDRALIDRLARRVLTLEHGRLLNDRPAAAEPTLPPAPATLDLAAREPAEVEASEDGDPHSGEAARDEAVP